jgi:iron complex outermembrane recepter protein
VFFATRKSFIRKSKIKMKRLLPILAFMIIFQPAISQQVIRGIITDSETGNPLPGATVQELNSRKATATGPGGRFELNVDHNSELSLRVSFLGYRSYSTTFSKEALPQVIEISLEPGASMLGAVVVTATRSSRDVHDVPVRIDVITPEKVENTPALSADELLRAVPGVSVSRAAAFLSSSTVSLRGMGSEQGRTLVMVDGVPVNKADGGSVNWNAINPDDIQQVEVMKGPGSSIHGGNAMGGVINLISPAPTQRIQGNVGQRYGTFATAHSQASLSGRSGDFFWGVNGMYRQSDGYITTPFDETDQYSVASFLDEYQFGLRTGYFFTAEQMLEVTGGYYSGKRGTGTQYAGFGFENDHLAAPEGAYNTYTGLNGRINYRGTLGRDAQLRASFFGQRENYQNIRESMRNNRVSRFDVESIRQDLGFLSSLNFSLNGNHQLTTGFDMRHGSVDGADVYRTSTDEVLNLGKMNQLGVFLQNEVSLGNQGWSLMAGIRYDYASFFDGAFIVNSPTNETAFLQAFSADLDDATFSAISPRLSMQYHQPGSFRIFGGYSRGFRAPVLDDMCRTGRISGGMKIANPNLKPEYLDHYELGADVWAGRRLTISPSVYYSSGRDYHAYIATGDSLQMGSSLRPIRIKDNIGKVGITGGELALEYQMTQNINWSLAYSRIQTNIIEHRVLNPDRDADLTGNALVYQPRDIFHASLSWRNAWVNAFLAFNYKGAQWTNDVNTQEIEAFNHIDLHLFRDIAAGFSAAFMIHNLLDSDYVDSRNIIAPGRMITASLSYRF